MRPIDDRLTRDEQELVLLALACYCQQHRAAVSSLAPGSPTANTMLQELDRASSLMVRIGHGVRQSREGEVHSEVKQRVPRDPPSETAYMPIDRPNQCL